MKTIDQIRRENLAILVSESEGVGALAKRANKSDSQISQWLNASKNSGTGKPRGMRSSSCRELEDACKKPLGWMDIDHHRGVSKAAGDVGEAKLIRIEIPVISFRKASQIKEINVPYSIDSLSDYIVVDEYYSDFSFAIEIEDDSMSPNYIPGDFVLFDPALEPLPGDHVLVKNSRGECFLRIYRTRGEDRDGKIIFEAAPSNTNFSTLRSDETSLEILAVVKEFRRKVKK